MKLIDADSTKVEAYLYDCNTTPPTPLNDGKVSTYKFAVEEKFGSEELFFNSVFAAQKKAGLAKAKPAKRKELFCELLGITRYIPYEEFAKGKGDEQDKELSRLRGRRESLATSKERLAELKQEIERQELFLEGRLEGIAKIELGISKLNDDLQSIERKIFEAESFKELIAPMQAEKDKVQKQKDEAEKQYEISIDVLVKKEDELEAKIQRSRRDRKDS